MNCRVAVPFVGEEQKEQRLMTNSHRSILSLVCTAGAVAAVLLGGPVSTASAAASLTPLGDLPGGVFDSRANAVSGDGSVVVGTSSSASGAQTFRWTAGGGMVGLGVLPGGNLSRQPGPSENHPTCLASPQLRNSVIAAL